MAVRSHRDGEDTLQAILAELRAHLSAEQAPAFEHFVRLYYERVPADDLAPRRVADLYGAALAHWHFLHQRLPGTPAVRLYNPGVEWHGWQSPHTVLEIVTDDMPFLVDSVSMALHRQGLSIHLIIHPVLRVRRHAKGALEAVLEPADPDPAAIDESVMRFEVDRRSESEALRELAAVVKEVLRDVRVAVTDWEAMRSRLDEVLAVPPPPGTGAEADAPSDPAAFLRWLRDDHFTFLGYREYALTGGTSRPVPGSALGVLSERLNHAGEQNRPCASSDEAIMVELAHRPLLITKARGRSTVHRPAYLDYLVVPYRPAETEDAYARCFLGLFTSSAYHTTIQEIPWLGAKARAVMLASGLAPRSHSGKALWHILETLPRDELLEASAAELRELALRVMHLQDRQRVRLFVRHDTPGGFYSCLVYVPREHFDTELRERIQGILMEALGGVEVEFTPVLSESVLARIHFVVRVGAEPSAELSLPDLERRIVRAVRTWPDDLMDALIEQVGEEQASGLYCRYERAFPGSYRDDFRPVAAALDIVRMEGLGDSDELGMCLYQPAEAAPGNLRFKLFHRAQPIALSDVLPMLENMSLRVVDERPYRVAPADRVPMWIHDFGITNAGGDGIAAEDIRETLQEAFARVWRGEVENDGLNRLVVRAGLSWREVVILRAYGRYLRQTGLTHNPAYVEQTLAGNAHISRLLVQLFVARFDPRRQDKAAVRGATLAADLQEAIDAVPTLEEDRILRRYFYAIQATVRTSHFQQGEAGEQKGWIAFKLDTANIPDMPLPRPAFDIFVYSPMVEGVHLRAGKVARGGLRWSDRLEDYRTEVLGLMKAQQVKNTVIVPVGAKGGFVIRQPLPQGDREALRGLVERCYRMFVGGLLDLTDNLHAGTIVPPPGVVRYDDDDPYLVVAADKGTADLSDVANAVAAEHEFWLGDAFASGGSSGYDHKKMAITARGAWESVCRHFRELGLDAEHKDFTAVGIGDMSGDVFGNGALMSRHMRLLAAFDHRHIFIDPNPDAEVSYQERQRLFALPRSSWADYDSSLISAGGGVHSRKTKFISLSAEAKVALGITANMLTPAALISAILRAPVDLLWNGGIGTFVKASAESDANAGDRSNDGLRINASELRCKVVGEGGNLGLTQLARIELALAGGKVNTDFIDNSGGVDCSDHEVNIKILLGTAMTEGELTLKQRNKLLVEMTDEVAARVLQDNYLQTQALSLAEFQASARLEDHRSFIHKLEAAAGLDRALEFLPKDEELVRRKAAGKGLTRPELAVQLAYGKLYLYHEILASDLPDDPFYAGELDRYFPAPVRERFRTSLAAHPLAREIVSTRIANDLVNRAGASFAFQLHEDTGAATTEIVRAYTVVRRIFGMGKLWKDIENLDGTLSPQTQIAMMREVQALTAHSAKWLLQNRRPPLDVTAEVAALREGLSRLCAALPELLVGPDKDAMDDATGRYVVAGVPHALARRVAGLPLLAAALDIAELARWLALPAEVVGGTYFSVAARLELHWLRQRIAELPADSHWQSLARSALRDELYAQQRLLTAEVLRVTPHPQVPAAVVEAWLQHNRGAVEHTLDRLAEVKASETPDLAMLSVGLREVGNLVKLGNRRMAAPDQEEADTEASVG